MRVETTAIHEDYNFRDVFKILRVRFQHERFDGSMSEEVERIVFERGNAVGVLLYDAENDTVLLIKQFRYPAYLRDQSGWLIEIVAGVIDKGRDGLTVAHSELVEEIGYEVSELTPLCSCYLSPGGTTEQVHVYLGYLRQAERVNAGGGLASEHEDIQLLTVPFIEALSMIQRGEICDAKTIIALQRLAFMNQRSVGKFDSA